MDMPDIISLLIVISEAFSYLNLKFLRLRGTIRVMTIPVMMSVVVLLAGTLDGSRPVFFVNMANNLDFTKLLLDVMPGFLIKVNALHIDIKDLRGLLPVAVLSNVGVLLSSAIFVAMFYLASLVSHSPCHLFSFSIKRGKSRTCSSSRGQVCGAACRLPRRCLCLLLPTKKSTYLFVMQSSSFP